MNTDNKIIDFAAEKAKRDKDWAAGDADRETLSERLEEERRKAVTKAVSAYWGDVIMSMGDTPWVTNDE